MYDWERELFAMNWLTKISQLGTEPVTLDHNLTLLSLRELQKYVLEQSDMDIPGQQYFWNMPDLQHARRRQPAESAKNIQEIRKYFNDIFEEWGLGKYNIVNDDYDEEEVENEVNEYVNMYVENFAFRNDDKSKTWEFINYISDEELNEAWRAAFNFEQYLYNPGTSRRFFNRMMGEAKRWMEANKAADVAVDDSVLQEVVQEYIDYRDDPNGSDEALLDKIAEMTTEVMLGNIEYENSSSSWGRHYDKLPVEDVPFWIDWSKLQDALTDDFDDSLHNWYKQDNTGQYGGLDYSARESISESRWENYNEVKRQFEHGYGMDPEVLFDNYEREDDQEDTDELDNDPRYVMELSMTQDIADDLMDGDAARVINNARTIASVTQLNVAAIHTVIMRDDSLKKYFGDEAANLQADPNTIHEAINWMLGINEDEKVPEGETEEQLLDRQQKKVDDMKANYDKIPEALRANTNAEDFMAKIMEQMKIREQALLKRHWKLRRETGRLTEEDLERMQELGLARRPFPHRYVVERSQYPGAGFAQMNQNLHPFRITVSPEIDQSVIPPELFSTFSLHTMGEPGPVTPEEEAAKRQGQWQPLPAMGWIGGYADYDEGVMYIMEVQSDLMQRTSHMRDPKKMEEAKTRDIAQFQNKLTQLQRSLEKAQQSNPKQNMRQIIVRIRQENAALDPNSPKYNQNLSRVEQLETQLSRMPDVQDTSHIEQQIDDVTRQLQEAQARPTGSKADQVYTKGNPEYWHDYKSKVENLFKDWVPIFFNVAIREAKRREFNKVRIIDASSLAKIWNQYSDKDTVELFKRVYDRTAALRYNATHGVWDGYGFYDIDLQNPELRVAEMKANWLQKVAQAQSAETWFAVNPTSGKMAWQEHLDAFFNSMQGTLADDVYDQTIESIEGPTQEFEGGYVDVDPMREENLSRIKDKQNIFAIWLRLVPPELKEGDDLSRDFKNQVRTYLLETQEFDPYQAAEVEEVETPSANDLEDMWG